MRVLRQESVTGMDGVTGCDFGGAEDVRDVAVAEARIGRSDTEMLIGHPDVHGIIVHLGVDRHAADAEFLAGPDDPNRNFSAVCHEDFFEHLGLRRARFYQKQRFAVLDRLRVFLKNLYYPPIDFTFDFIHQLHGFHNTEDLTLPDVSPLFNIGLRLGRRRSVENADNGRRDGEQALHGWKRRRHLRRLYRADLVVHRNGHFPDGRRPGGILLPQSDPQPLTFHFKIGDARGLENINQFLQQLRIDESIRPRPCGNFPALPGRLGSATFHQARSTYSRVRLSTFTTTPSSRYRGTLIVAPLSRIAGFEPPDAVSPRTPGSVFTTLSSTNTGNSMPMGTALWRRIFTVISSLSRSQPSPNCFRLKRSCS